MSDQFAPPPVVYVDLIKVTPKRKFARQRPQPWRWIAKNAANNKPLARSTERYTNEADCRAAITQLFGVSTTVFLRQAEAGNELLRQAVES